MPSITYGLNTGNNTALQDTGLRSTNPTSNDSSATTHVIYTDAGGDTWRTILRLSDLSGITAGSTITAVEIGIYSSFSAGGSNAVSVHKILQATVVSQATWDIYSTGNNWATAGAASSGTDIASSASATITVAGAAGYETASGSGLVADVQEGLDGSGVVAWRLSNQPSSPDFLTTISCEGTDGQRPYVTVTYTEPSTGDPRTLMLLGVG